MPKLFKPKSLIDYCLLYTLFFRVGKIHADVWRLWYLLKYLKKAQFMRCRNPVMLIYLSQLMSCGWTNLNRISQKEAQIETTSYITTNEHGYVSLIILLCLSNTYIFGFPFFLTMSASIVTNFVAMDLNC